MWYDTEEIQNDFFNDLNRSEQKTENRQPEAGRQYTHKYDESIEIKLISPTAKGWKVTQFDSKTPSGNRRRNPKRKTAFYSDSEIKELFTMN